MAEGIQIRFDDKDVIQRLDKAHEASDHLHPLFEKISATMKLRTQGRFETETDPDGKKWPGLKPRTANRRIGSGRRGYDHMLRVRNSLYNSIVSSSDDTSAVVGTNLKYAAIHNLGGEIEKAARQSTVYQRYNEKTDVLNQRFVKKSKSNFARDVTIGAHTIKIPAREFLGFGAGDRTEVMKIIEEHFREEDGFDGASQ